MMSLTNDELDATEFAAKMFSRCVQIWFHADGAQIPVEKRREDIIKMFIDAVKADHGDGYEEAAIEAANQVCDRLLETEKVMMDLSNNSLDK